MDLDSALTYARERQRGVLATIRSDGRPQLSNIMYVAVDDELWISVTSSRAKTKNLRRDPRSVLYVPGEDFWNYVVLDGTVSLTDVTTDEHDDVAEQLVEYYRRGSGEHPDWDDFRSTMVREGRLRHLGTARAQRRSLEVQG
jgi:PPOX class probable F420-dependent enzyme